MRVEQPDVAPDLVFVFRVKLVTADTTDAVVAKGEGPTQCFQGCEIQRSIVERLVALCPVPMEQSESAMLIDVGSEDPSHQKATL